MSDSESCRMAVYIQRESTLAYGAIRKNAHGALRGYPTYALNTTHNSPTYPPRATLTATTLTFYPAFIGYNVPIHNNNNLIGKTDG